jgi:hypothetical protein
MTVASLRGPAPGARLRSMAKRLKRRLMAGEGFDEAGLVFGGIGHEVSSLIP